MNNTTFLAKTSLQRLLTRLNDSERKKRVDFLVKRYIYRNGDIFKNGKRIVCKICNGKTDKLLGGPATSFIYCIICGTKYFKVKEGLWRLFR